jgi:branched-chain amino acid aminotransferase
MIVFVNGQFVPEEQAVVSVFDRGFLLGDGLFETVQVRQGVPFRWAQHAERLQRGAALLRLPLPTPVAGAEDATNGPCDLEPGRAGPPGRPCEWQRAQRSRPTKPGVRLMESLRPQVGELIRRNGLSDAVLRITVSRGPGPRGYSITGAGPSTLVMALHPTPAPAPKTWRVATSAVRLVTGDPLAGVKTCSKAWQVMARAEAEAKGADEALLLNTDGQLAEGAGANLFWIEGGLVCTPPVSAGILPGITRALVLELCAELGVPVCETNGTRQTLLAVEGVFFTLSTWGIVPASELDGCPLPHSPLVDRLQAASQNRLLAETATP